VNLEFWRNYYVEIDPKPRPWTSCSARLRLQFRNSLGAQPREKRSGRPRRTLAHNTSEATDLRDASSVPDIARAEDVGKKSTSSPSTQYQLYEICF